MSAAFLRIGTRGSPLALAQARETRRRLATLHDIHLLITDSDLDDELALELEAAGPRVVRA